MQALARLMLIEITFSSTTEAAMGHISTWMSDHLSYTSGPVFTKGLSQGLGLKLRLLSQVSAQKPLRLLS